MKSERDAMCSRLEITPSASALIQRMIAPLPGVHGVRLTVKPDSARQQDEPGASVIVTAAAEASDGEEVLVCGELSLFVTPAAAGLVDDKLLDVVPAGADRLRFMLSRRQ